MNTPQPRQIVWARILVENGCFLLYDSRVDHDVRMSLAAAPPRLVLCTPAGLALRTAITELGYISVTVEVYDTEPEPVAEWADDTVDCDFSSVSGHLQLQSLMGENAATVWIGAGRKHVRAHRRATPPVGTEYAEEWLFHLWPIPDTAPDAEAETAAVDALMRAAARRTTPTGWAGRTR